jgi:hypothetical protein
MLEELPVNLDETYGRILRDINESNRDHAHRLLQCLTVAVRPLRVSELAEVLAVDFGAASRGGTSMLNTDWRWEDQERAVLSTCSSLISIVDEDGSQVVQFSHFSVKEFLTSSRLAVSSGDVSRFHIHLEPAHTILAKACLGVLLQLDEHVERDNSEKSSPLARYAAEHWVEHAKFEQVSSHVRKEMEDLFDTVNPCFAAWLRVHDIDADPPESPLSLFSVSTPRRVAAAPLYYAALCGIYDLEEHLVIKCPRQQVNANGGYYVSPLGAALGMGYLDVAQLLYDHGADVNVQGQFGRTLLFSAAGKGHRETVEWLLNHGADPNRRCDENDALLAPLHVAAWIGQVEISRILIHFKVDQNALDRSGQTPLHLASDISTASRLLEHGVDVDNSHSTALHLASRNSSFEVTCLLLEHGADLNAEDEWGRTPFPVASGHLRNEITKSFLNLNLYPIRV